MFLSLPSVIYHVLLHVLLHVISGCNSNIISHVNLANAILSSRYTQVTVITQTCPELVCLVINEGGHGPSKGASGTDARVM